MKYAVPQTAFICFYYGIFLLFGNQSSQLHADSFLSMKSHVHILRFKRTEGRSYNGLTRVMLKFLESSILYSARTRSTHKICILGTSTRMVRGRVEKE